MIERGGPGDTPISKGGPGDADPHIQHCSKSTPKPLKNTIFDCILKHKTLKIFRLRRAIPIHVLITRHTNSSLENTFLHL